MKTKFFAYNNQHDSAIDAARDAYDACDAWLHDAREANHRNNRYPTGQHDDNSPPAIRPRYCI